MGASGAPKKPTVAITVQRQAPAPAQPDTYEIPAGLKPGDTFDINPRLRVVVKPDKK